MPGHYWEEKNFLPRPGIELVAVPRSLHLLRCEGHAWTNVRSLFLTPEYGQIQWGVLQRTVFINKIRMLQRTRRNTIGRHSTRVCMTCRAFPLRLEGHSSSMLSFVSFSYQFSSVISLVQLSAYLYSTRLFVSPSGIFRTRLRNNQDRHGRKEHINRLSKFLSYLTGARYVHPWWHGRCQSCIQVPATRVATFGGR